MKQEQTMADPIIGETEDRALKKSFRSIDVIALAFGSMIGWGWIMLCGKWAVDGGTVGAIIAFAIGSLLCIFVGMTYAELTPALPAAGGGVIFSLKSMGKTAALVAGLATTLAYLGVASWEGPALVSSIAYLVPVPEIGYLWTIQGQDVYLSWTFIAVGMAVVLTYINVRGAKQTAVFQTVATIGIVFVGLLFLSGGLLFGNVEYTKPLFTSTAGLMSVLLVVPAMFVGFDVIPQAASEMSVPLKKIPGILVLSIVAAAMWYILMILATTLSAPSIIRESGVIPVADSMAYAFGSPFWGKICIIGALCGIITSWNGFLFGSARCLYSMSKLGLLPAALAKTHPKYQTPYVAVCFCGIVCILTAFLGKGALVWFVDASSFGTVIMYAMVVLSFIVLRVKEPNMKRPYRIKNGKLIGILAASVVVFFVYLYLPMGPSSLNGVEWFMVLLWFVLGFAIYGIYRFHNSNHSNASEQAR